VVKPDAPLLLFCIKPKSFNEYPGSRRLLLLIRSITSTTSGHEAWPQVKPVLRRALETRRQIAREGWWN
jgi:hypothetical protein